MKIEKGHYVPKELITSEAIHKLVVMCFEAAGHYLISDEITYGVFMENNYKGLGIGNFGVGHLITGGVMTKPLTLQELLTADNSIQWPEWAVDIRLNYGGDRAYFTGSGFWCFVDELATKFSRNHTNRPDLVILATRKPAEEKFKVTDNAIVISGLSGSSENVTTDNVKKESTEQWYDYDKQVAIALPPVGVECDVYCDQKWERCFILHHANNDFVDVAACRIPQHKGSQVGFLAWADEFRPLDWNRKAEEERQLFVNTALNIASGGLSIEMYEKLYDSGLFKLNKAP